MSRYAGLLGRRLRLAAVVAAVPLACLFAAVAAPAAGTAAQGCPHATARPGRASPTQLRTAILCLVNNARAAKGLDPLGGNADLHRMARRHTVTMLASNCFHHRCDGEPGLAKRLKQSGYLHGATKWRYAEDIGYETTPRHMVTRWLATSGDEANLLSSDYADVGIGGAQGSPEPGADDSKFETFTVDLAYRTPAG